MSSRGAYAKGVAKREEIATAALDVIDRVGFRRAGIREIAEAVGLSQTGLLHYYGSREELLVDVLRKRDERNRAKILEQQQAAPSWDEFSDWLVGQARNNADSPGLVRLFAQLSVDAADDAHPAAAFFRERNIGLRGHLASAMSAAQAAGNAPRSIDPAILAVLVHAVADGVQTLALSDANVDAVEVLTAFTAILRDAAAGQDAAE